MCQFMYNLQETEDGIIYKCNNCKHSEENHESLVNKTDYKSKEFSFKIPGEYLIYDKSIPITNKKQCPNEKCISRKEKDKQECIFYNEKNTVKLTFLCKQCLTSWNYS